MLIDSINVVPTDARDSSNIRGKQEKHCPTNQLGNERLMTGGGL